MALTPGCDQCLMGLPGTILFSLSYCLYVPTLWASPSFLANEKAIGLAYGYIGSVRNLGVSIVTIISGIISDQYKGYLMVLPLLNS
jgi:hypothetical protein